VKEEASVGEAVVQFAKRVSVVASRDDNRERRQSASRRSAGHFGRLNFSQLNVVSNFLLYSAVSALEM